ncbi:hypothetical protein AX16_002784 [Volvariella volvacea WC 439]|nr:hypothetical protein AX16_002784 [Volvariella volvacea WC 439]
MSSPSNTDGPSTVTPSSPVPISPARRRSTSPSGHSDITSRPRHSPTIARSFDPNDPQARERQRTMDVDMAMHLSRARRETLSITPTVTPHDHIQSSPEMMFQPGPSISPHLERNVGLGDAPTPVPEDEEEEHGGLREGQLIPTDDVQQAQMPLIDTRAGSPTIHLGNPDDATPSLFGGLPTYQPNVSQSHFDFRSMEEFAVVEKNALGFTSTGPTVSPGPPRFTVVPQPESRPSSTTAAETPPEQPSPPSGEEAPVAGGPSEPNNGATSTPRIRQRKFSQSNPKPRQRRGVGGKMALFERAFGEPPPALPPHLGIPPIPGSRLHSGPSFEHQPGLPGGILNTGHDRPYRFSFYSNALSATIHARSLSELPAEGQSFQDLFSGVPPPAEDGYRSLPPAPRANGDQKSPWIGGNGLNGDGNSDANTWWLDVLSPTDEEMKMLSKVFNIHPLTTEDILMEEAREKIELFRNYYLVCFRSFDQDPYSPTYLEPLNMYIIVFREGTLSFHFHPTPHPANVRRRIKHLKDYISVTSDWISYALIDDITDAFGPLIQSIEYEVDSIDELVLILKETERSDMLLRIGRCRKKVMGLLRLMGNKADVVKGLAKRCNENWRVAPTSDIGLYLSDIQDHLITMTQNLNHYEKILSRSHSNYLAQISIEMTDANNQINDVLSKLTALGTVLIPMNLVTGLWGMNVHVPGEGQPGYAWFISIIACLAAFAIIGGYSTYKFMVRK